MFVDACRNHEKKVRGRAAFDDQTPNPPRGVCAFFSCSAGQSAYEDNELKHGIFFYHLLQGMRGQAKNAREDVTIFRLIDHATQMVEAASSAGADREQAQEILEHLWLRLQRELRAAVQQRQPPTAHSGLIAALRATRSAGLAIRGYTAAPLAIERMLRHVGDALSAPTLVSVSPLRGRPSHARE